MIQTLRKRKAKEQIEQFWAAMQKLGFTRDETLSMLQNEKEGA